MNIFTTGFYINSPIWMQECMLSLRGLKFRLLRQGKMFRRLVSELEKSQYYSEQELRSLQNEKFRIIIKHSYENVPYYRRLFKKLNLTPEDFKDASDISKLPLISKSDVKGDPEDFLAKNTNKLFMRTVFTSGSTGSPLKIFRDMHLINFENAILARQYRWAGFNPGDKKVIIRSSPIVPAGVKKPPFWRRDVFQNSLCASSYHLSKENIDSYAREILRYSSDALETVPSQAYILAKLAFLKGAELNFKHIFTSSEVLMPEKKVFIEKQFKGRVFDHYGTAERVSAIGMCEKGTYHVYSDYSITEFLPVPGRKGQFEIVGSTLNSFAMPLFRYKTGDIVTMPSAKTCSCGRNFPIIGSIEGRNTDQFFITKDGRMISLFCSIFSTDLKDVIEAQFIQEDLDKLKVKLVAGDRYDSSDEALIKTNIKNYLGKNVIVDIEKVDSVPRTNGGKFKQFISKIKEKEF
ncbi:phenylacetate--CoA ligase family protein [Candidatus Omnitrophota bacterium]